MLLFFCVSCQELKQQQQTTTGDQRDNSKASNVGGTEDKAIQAEDTVSLL